MDGESEDAQLQDAHVILAQVRGVVYSDPRGIIQTWGRQDRSEDAGEWVTGCRERGLGRQGWGCEQESVGLLHQCLEDSASPSTGASVNALDTHQADCGNCCNESPGGSTGGPRVSQERCPRRLGTGNSGGRREVWQQEWLGSRCRGPPLPPQGSPVSSRLHPRPPLSPSSTHSPSTLPDHTCPLSHRFPSSHGLTVPPTAQPTMTCEQREKAGSAP